MEKSGENLFRRISRKNSLLRFPSLVHLIERGTSIGKVHPMDSCSAAELLPQWQCPSLQMALRNTLRNSFYPNQKSWHTRWTPVSDGSRWSSAPSILSWYSIFNWGSESLNSSLPTIHPVADPAGLRGARIMGCIRVQTVVGIAQ